MTTTTATSVLCHWETLADSATTLEAANNDRSHRVVIREWPDRPQVDVVHEQRVRSTDPWQAADLEEVHPLVHITETPLCEWTETTYRRGIHMASHRRETDHRVVIRPITSSNELGVVHERCGPDEIAWTPIDTHQISR